METHADTQINQSKRRVANESAGCTKCREMRGHVTLGFATLTRYVACVCKIKNKQGVSFDTS